ncbi:hypothetical protein DFJ77DRAFT_479580 [Powellomyces hirtus]|nr:hypothetical protein DFJ77DRAFT_479580 [Powellomyces hirtus]
MSITILPVRLQLLSLPKEALPGIMHAVVKNLHFRGRNDTFFSYTENHLEVSIIADTDTVAHDFARYSSTTPGLVICPDPFRALQIDGVGDGGGENAVDSSAQRINEISRPLAKAGVSILYLSTYQTDYVFVKERRMELVVRTLKESDFDFLDVEMMGDGCDSSSPPATPSPPASINPTTPTNTTALPPPPSSERTPLEPLLATRKIVPCDSVTASPVRASRMHAQSSEAKTGDTGADDNDDDLLRNGKFLARKLVPQYTVRLVGLNREFIDLWITTIIKIIFYEHLIRAKHTRQHLPRPTSTASLHRAPSVATPTTSGRFFNYTATEDGISLVADESVLFEFPTHVLNESTPTRPLKCIQVDLTDYGLDRYGIVYSMADPLASNHINLLYLSTYVTANILVDAEDLKRAIMILDDVVQREEIEIATRRSSMESDSNNSDAVTYDNNDNTDTISTNQQQPTPIE